MIIKKLNIYIFVLLTINIICLKVSFTKEVSTVIIGTTHNDKELDLKNRLIAGQLKKAHSQ